eukprot:COSAG01_NODE_7_length_54400_cov_1218.054935_15_plen_431_part_00
MLKEIKNLKAFTQSRQSLLENNNDLDLLTLLQGMRLAIRTKGDQAILDYTEKFDKIKLKAENIKITTDEIKHAYKLIDPIHLDALKEAKQNIATFHEIQKPKNWQINREDGLSYGNSFIPLEYAALYVPGGRNPYPSSVLMNALPAIIAGVKHPYILTPPNQEKNIAPSILVAADLCGIKDIYKVGGAQAIFAAAYGTKSIPKADKITGPGNRYVTAAKQAVYGLVDIDKPAGPSEVVIYCDNINYSAYAAAECLAQMEHDPLASAILICSNESIAIQVNQELAKQIKNCARADIIKKAAKQSGYIISPTLDQGISALDAVASEHVVLLSNDTHNQSILEQVQHGASIFIGPYTPVAIGDYFAGPNHVLPTNAAARYASPLGVLDFMKYRSETKASKAYLETHAEKIITLAEKEALDAHAKSVSIRIPKN